jgi:N-acetylneuraminic acid mutarotase
MNKPEQISLAFALLVLSSFIPGQPGPGNWEIVKTSNRVHDRSECGMASSNGKLYVIGGDGDSPVESFDPVSLSWATKSAPPVGMNHFEAVSYDGKIYVLEAFSGGGFPDQTPLSNIYIYDTKNDKWKTGSGLALERRRAAAGAAEYHGKLYLAAGIQHGHSSGTNSMFDMYDPLTDRWTALPDAPHIRDHCEAAVVGDKLYVAGGRNTSYHEAGNFMAFFSKTVLEVDCYDFKTASWSTISARLPLGTGGGSMVNLNGTLYYMGGERATATESNAPRKNTFCYNPAMETQWTETDSLKMARNGMSAAVLNNTIYVFGGAGGGPGGPPMPNPASGNSIPNGRPSNNPADSSQRPTPGGRPGGPAPDAILERFNMSH